MVEQIRHEFAVILSVLAAGQADASAQAMPRVDLDRSTAIAPLAGQLSTPAEGQTAIEVWGTDMGFYFEHQGALWFLFGDTVKDGKTGAHIAPAAGDPPGDDALGIVCLRNGPLCPAGSPLFPTGQAVDEYIAAHPAAHGQPGWRAAAPPVVFPSYAAGESQQLRPIAVASHGRTPRSMLVPIPGPGFSNNKQGSELGAFAVFNGPMARCAWGCPQGFECNAEAGVYAHPAHPPVTGDDGGYLPCKLSSSDPACRDVAGLCFDPTSPVRAQPNPDVLLDQSARRFELGNADTQRSSDSPIPWRFNTQSWITHKMTNPAITTVNDFDERRSIHGPDANDYRPPHGPPSERQKVFIWSRAGFALNGKAWAYFAYAEMPSYSATADFAWHPRFFTGLSDSGVPQFSDLEVDAQPLTMNVEGPPSPDEPWSLVNMISVRFIVPLNKWVMLYGGGSTLSPLPAGSVVHPENAMFIRFADQPFGPWTEPQVLFSAGDPTKDASELVDTAYGPGGILFHVGCTSATCAPGEQFWKSGVPPFSGQPYGFLYGPNLIQEWSTTREQPTSGVDIYWTVSTFAPYQVVLMRSFVRTTP